MNRILRKRLVGANFVWRLGWVALAVCVLLSGCRPHDAKTARELSEGYKFEFETEPPTGVKVLNARIMSAGDWGVQWLKLHAETNALDGIILKKFTLQNRPPEELASAQNKYTPDWWVLPPPSQLEYYTCQKWTHGGWHFSSAVIAVHRADGIVFFCCERID